MSACESAFLQAYLFSYPQVTLTGQVTVYGKTTDVNYVILEGRSTAVANDDCEYLLFSVHLTYLDFFSLLANSL